MFSSTWFHVSDNEVATVNTVMKDAYLDRAEFETLLLLTLSMEHSLS
jgi:hypothetical protein